MNRGVDIPLFEKQWYILIGIHKELNKPNLKSLTLGLVFECFLIHFNPHIRVRNDILLD